MNVRANIMFFIEHLCDMAQRDDQPDYVKMMQRDRGACQQQCARPDLGLQS